MQYAERRYPWQPWKREPPQKKRLTGTVTPSFSGDTYLREYLPERILTKPPSREREQVSAMIYKAKIDPL